MNSPSSLLDRYIALFPPAERHEREREIRQVICGENDPYLVTAILTAEARKAVMDAVARQPQMPRRSFFALSAAVAFVVGIVAAVTSASVTSQVTTNNVHSRMVELEAALKKSTETMAKADAANMTNYKLAEQFREMLVMGVAMARVFNATPGAGMTRDGSNMLITTPKGMLSLGKMDDKRDCLVIRRDLVGTGLENDVFERELEKANAVITNTGKDSATVGSQP